MKTHTTINVDSETLKKAKLCYINISQTAERALKLKLKPTVHNAPTESLSMTCCICGKENLVAGYLCEDRNKLYCQDCNIEAIGKCVHKLDRMHEHIRIPSFNGVREE